MSEYNEAVVFSAWCNFKNIDHWHIIQENLGSRDGEKVRWGRITKLKNQGWKKGVSDYLVYLPAVQCKFNKAVLLWIELKKPRNRKKSGEFRALSSDGINVYPEQIEFIKKMNNIGSVQGEICFGSDEAISFVEKFLKR